ncbi:hypothetical protein PoB_001789300 [Plakobranchus ocellatus]|uniref:Uncharacterized protein n=1 Tax=Plakobranchus ocellatus TaxID=259542 RepID=A0AAV3ZAB0_9GAST|nr:hypothetical protein PoB_001789300 [Plakobranchus ocellatus]
MKSLAQHLKLSRRQHTHRVAIFLLNVWFSYIASPQQSDLGLSGPPSGQDASGGARTLDRRVPADLRAGLLATEPPMPPPLSRESSPCHVLTTMAPHSEN